MGEKLSAALAESHLGSPADEPEENPLTPEISDAPEILAQAGQEPEQVELSASCVIGDDGKMTSQTDSNGVTTEAGKGEPTGPLSAAHFAAGGLTPIGRVRENRISALSRLIAIIGGNAKELLELLAGFDPAHLQGLLVGLTAYGEIKGTDESAKEEKVMRACQIFQAWANMTPGTRDDDFSNWVSRIIGNSGTRADFVALVQSQISGSPVVTVHLTDAAKAAGITPAEVEHFSSVIAEIIR